MINKTVLLAATAMTFLALAAGPAAADNGNILHATLTEANQKTAEVSTAEVRQILADGSTILIDTRPRPEFDAGHIPGAHNLDGPASERIAAVERLVGGQKSKALVLYCNGPYCQASRRMADELVSAGFTNVRRYQLGIPVWRALGGPVAVELDGVRRVFKGDKTAVFIDARAAADFATGSIAGARNAPVDDITSGTMKKVPLPEDDFNRRIVLFGKDGLQARKLADVLAKRPWHNVMYYPGLYKTLSAGLQ